MGYFVVVRIWESIPPASRISRYVAPLSAALISHRLGDVVGWSTRMSAELEIESVEFDLDLVNLDEGVNIAKLLLEESGAPAGSELRIEQGGEEKIIPFGKKEGLAIYLDGINLPDSVYERCTCDSLAFQINGALTSVEGEIRGSWVGRNETAIYIYGPNAEIMFSAIEPFLTSYPLCQNSRIVIRHGNPELNSRTVRLPFHEGGEEVQQVFWGGQSGSG